EKKCYADRAAELKEEYQKALENPTAAADDVVEEVADEEGTPEKVEEVAEEDDHTPEKVEVPADDE
nr:high mobility group box domain-containing protein [Tanacetum cinerariifolium]